MEGQPPQPPQPAHLAPQAAASIPSRDSPASRAAHTRASQAGLAAQKVSGPFVPPFPHPGVSEVEDFSQKGSSDELADPRGTASSRSPEPRDASGAPAFADILARDRDGLCFDPRLVYDRAFGAILGAALGDAFGLQAEGADPLTIGDRYPKGLHFPYTGALKGYPANDWTDATDCAVLVMRTLTAYFSSRTEDPTLDFAARLEQWHKTGFPELGDTVGVGPESVVARALAQPGYARDPLGAAAAVLGMKAENGALIRTVACAFTAAPTEWATRFCEATHADARCLASTHLLTALVNELSRVPDAEPIVPGIALNPVACGRACLEEEGHRADYMRRLTETAQLAALGLGDRDRRSYTFKTLACAMWAFRQLIKIPPARRDAGFFQSSIACLAAQGGDASANCAVAGAIFGAALGHRRLPAEWLQALPNHEWLLAETATFLQAASITWEVPDERG